KKVIEASLQPVWEGLACGLWDEVSLKALQQALALDLLRDYPKAIRQQITIFADSWIALTDPKKSHLRSGAFPITLQAARIYPSGWRLLNQAGLFRLSADTLVPVVDPESHRLYPLEGKALSRAIGRAHVTLDPLSHMIIPWQVATFEDAIFSTAHAQA